VNGRTVSSSQRSNPQVAGEAELLAAAGFATAEVADPDAAVLVAAGDALPGFDPKIAPMMFPKCSSPFLC